MHVICIWTSISRSTVFHSSHSKARAQNRISSGSSVPPHSQHAKILPMSLQARHMLRATRILDKPSALLPATNGLVAVAIPPATFVRQGHADARGGESLSRSTTPSFDAFSCTYSWQEGTNQTIPTIQTAAPSSCDALLATYGTRGAKSASLCMACSTPCKTHNSACCGAIPTRGFA